MTVCTFPGGLRIGFMNEIKTHVDNPAPQDLEPKVQLLVLLQGHQVFEIDDETFDLDARQDGPAACLMRIERPCRLRYVLSEGTPYQKIAIASTLGWADMLSDTADCLPTGQNSFRQWRPCRTSIRLSSQILQPPPQESDAQTRLYRMSRGLEILRRALSDGQEADRGDAGMAERIRLHLLRHLEEDLPLDRIEREIGLNRRSLQRLFKAHFGLTMRDYMRSERLARARRALSEDGVTIAQAAHIAGYSTPENFATAFRRAFDMPPQTLRNRSI